VFGVCIDEFDEGLEEFVVLLDVVGGCCGMVEVVVVLKIVCGLDYYIGMVMEIVMEGYEYYGFVCLWYCL